MVLHMPRRAARVMVLLLCSMGVGLAACSVGGTGSSTAGSSGSATTTGTTSAQAILNRAEHAALRDTSFSISGSAGAGSGPVPPTAASLSGQGALTMSPQRTKCDFAAIGLFGVSAPAQVIIDEHDDVYANAPPLNQWVKVDPSQFGAILGTLNILDYSAISNPVLIGTETVNQQVTWHVQGTLLAQTASVARRLEDVWIRQSDAYPVKLAIHTVPDPNGTPTSDNRVLDVTLVFQQWDTGITIALPTNVISP